MNIYYVNVSSSKNYNYNFINIEKTSKSILDIQQEILLIPGFCREQKSISVRELKSYLVSGISFFTQNANANANLDNQNQITGLINFDINQTTINIMGICVPGTSQGIGSFLMNNVKHFAKANNIDKIKLTCYDNLKTFYLKQGFKITNTSTFYDSDSDNDSDSNNESYNKIRYEMEYDMNDFIIGGMIKRKIKRRIKRKTIKKKKYILTKRRKSVKIT